METGPATAAPKYLLARQQLCTYPCLMGAALRVLQPEQELQWCWVCMCGRLTHSPQDLLSLSEEGQAAMVTPPGAQGIGGLCTPW